MSRTLRRPNAEIQESTSSYCNHKVAGRYTEYDRCPERNHIVFRPPTKEEWFFKFKHFHLDAGRNKTSWVPKWGRRVDQKAHRARHRQLISDFLQGKTDDVVHEKLGKFAKQWW